jgi:hypothetical protein
MQHQISLREANQHLRQLSPEQLAALERTRQRMKEGYDLGGRMPSRDELHER